MTFIRDTLSLLEVVVRDFTKYHKRYPGIVVDTGDKLMLGRVQVQVPDLGWTTNSIAPWCFPRQHQALVVPEVGQMVEVGFMYGSRNFAVYGPAIADVAANKLAPYTGPLMRVLYVDAKTGEYITYDASAKCLTASIGGAMIKVAEGKVDLNGDSKVFVTHTELNSALQSFVSAINAHIHLETGASTAAPTTPMSLDIANAKTTTIRTGG